MSTPQLDTFADPAVQSPPTPRPYVPDNVEMREFTLRAVLLGLSMTVVLGAANAYLGLRAGRTIAGTYSATIIAMAFLRLVKGSILEENIARTVGSIGGSVAAGTVFTIPAFVISRAWLDFGTRAAYLRSTALMLVGGTLGILMVTLLRRILIEDPELPFPESVAASEIHKAGQHGSHAAKLLFRAMGFGGLLYMLGEFKIFSATNSFMAKAGQIGRSTIQLGGRAKTLSVGAVTRISAPTISPAFFGVGYIIGPRLAALNFAGGVLAWGLLVPLILYLLGPSLTTNVPPGTVTDWNTLAGLVWLSIVRPIAIGGMLVGTIYTLFRMRKGLSAGMKRAVGDLRKASRQKESTERINRDLSFKVVFPGLGAALICTIALYTYFSGTLAGSTVAAIVMVTLAFFFAAVAGNIVGMIGSSNDPVSGLALSALIVAALMMAAIGISGARGVAVVLGVAAVICVSSGVSGEMMQDLKIGHILGGTPRYMQIGDFLGILAASLVMYFPLLMLHQGNINDGGIGFGDPKLPAPQAGMMAAVAQGIVGGEMAWPLILVGVFMGLAMILVQVQSPMLVAVGMYMPLETTFAVFAGGVLRWVMESIRDRRGYNEEQKARVDSAGVLTASGLIAGEALMGLVRAGFSFARKPIPQVFAHPPLVMAVAAFLLLASIMVGVPLRHAGSPEERR